MSKIDEYTRDFLNLQQFKEDNAEIFDEYEILQEKEQEAKAELQADIKGTMQDVENDIVRCVYVEVFKKSFNYDKFMNSANIEEIEVLNKAGGIKHEIIKETFSELVEKGKIDKKIKQVSFEEKQLSSRVIVKIK